MITVIFNILFVSALLVGAYNNAKHSKEPQEVKQENVQK